MENKTQNKRGLSSVVTTLIIILLVLVAVGIVWVVIRNVITGGTEDIGLGKFTTDLEIKNVNVEEDKVSVNVKRNPGKGELVGIKFIFYDGTNTETVQEDIIMEELEEKKFVFLSEELGEIDISNLEKVSIAGIFKSSSGKESVGNVADSYQVKEGSGEPCIPDCGETQQCGPAPNGCGGSNECGDCKILHGDTWYCQSGICHEGTPTCDLTSALWSETEVVEGSVVSLNVGGIGCAGISLNYSIYESDFGGSDIVDSFVVSILNPTWTAQWIDEGGLDPDPEYYFIATVTDNPSEEITSSDPKLSVTQGQTCDGPIIKTLYNTDYYLDDIYCNNSDGSDISGNVNWFKNDGLIQGQTSAILPSSQTSAGDRIICQVVGDLCNSTELVVKDLIPLDLNNEIASAGGDSYTISAGNYLLSGRVNVPEGFSIYGNGNPTLTLESSTTFFDLTSSNAGTIGNNVLRGITLEGRGVASRGVYAYKRSNIEIDNLEIRNTRDQAIWARGDNHADIITIDSSVSDICPVSDFGTIDFTNLNEGELGFLDRMLFVINDVYPLFKECPNFPDYIPNLAKNIVIKDCVIKNARISISHYGGMIEAARVHKMNVTGCSVTGENSYGIKIYDWGSFSYIADNFIDIAIDERYPMSHWGSCGIEVWNGGWFSKFYNNNVNRWLSADASPGAKIWNNTIIYSSNGSYGVETVLSDGAHVFNNFVRGAKISLSIDRSNERAIYESNKVFDAVKFGIEVYGEVLPIHDIVIRNNLVYNTTNTVTWGGRGIDLNQNVFSARIENNIIVDSYDSSLYLYNVEDTVVVDNTMVCWGIAGGEGQAIYNNGDPGATIVHGFERECNFPCTTNDQCNDYNSCTDDLCVGNVCQNTAVSDGTSCSDDLYCTLNERCMKGYCVTDAVDCDDDITCTWDICNETISGCTHDTRDCSACYYDGKCNAGIETSLTCPFECE